MTLNSVGRRETDLLLKGMVNERWIAVRLHRNTLRVCALVCLTVKSPLQFTPLTATCALAVARHSYAQPLVGFSNV